MICACIIQIQDDEAHLRRLFVLADGVAVVVADTGVGVAGGAAPFREEGAAAPRFLTVVEDEETVGDARRSTAARRLRERCGPVAVVTVERSSSSSSKNPSPSSSASVSPATLICASSTATEVERALCPRVVRCCFALAFEAFFLEVA